jgi:hypothetical protein
VTMLTATDIVNVLLDAYDGDPLIRTSRFSSRGPAVIASGDRIYDVVITLRDDETAVTDHAELIADARRLADRHIHDLAFGSADFIMIARHLIPQLCDALEAATS